MGFWNLIAADTLQLIGGAVTKGFRAAVFVGVLVLLLGILPWQATLANPPTLIAAWWFKPAIVLAAYAIVIGAAVWNRWRVKKDG